ncbi:hypothetical protein [Pseudanabaena sp. SR411]|uniref:hypothetical protein n=1 Tax=Pseudanabaena sp. SR411 TaxID=1980935 RepID=UPI001C3D232A|nr:hypothetical protein [Pseudanabaena sp. SR411]
MAAVIKPEGRVAAPCYHHSHYETDFGVSSAFGAGNTKIGFLKVHQRRTFKKKRFL